MSKKQNVESTNIVTTLVTPESAVATEPTVSLDAKPTLARTSDKEMPSAIELVGPALVALGQASVLIRAGFMFSTDQPPTMFASTGHMVVLLVPGDPEQTFVDGANDALELAFASEQFAKMDAEKRAATLEKQRAEEGAKAAVKAALAVQIAAAEAELKSLQAAQAAA